MGRRQTERDILWADGDEMRRELCAICRVMGHNVRNNKSNNIES